MSTAVATRIKPQPRPISAKVDAPPSSSGIAFFFFLAVTATLFVRPGEVLPDLQEVNLLFILVLVNLAVAFPSVLGQFAPNVLDRRPITTCVLGLLLAVVLSHLANSRFALVGDKAVDFLKVVVYYLLLISLVDSPKRLRIFVLWTLFCASVTVLLATLDFHEVIALPKLEKSIDHPEYTAVWDKTRMSGTGLFQDPNDLCMLVAMAVPLCLYALTDSSMGTLRLLWLGPLGMFLYGCIRTGSRGGFLALLIGLAAYLRARYGWGKTLLLGAVGAPLVAVLVGGRQAEISTRTQTAHQRIEIWSDGLEHFRSAPVFGVGKDEYNIQSGYVAHNSYLHAFAELGAFGGVLFLSVVYLPLSAMYRLCGHKTAIEDPEMRRLHPFLFGSVVAYAVGMLMLSLCYTMPTFAVLGMSAAFLGVAVTRPVSESTKTGLDEKFDAKLILRMTVAGVCFLVGIYVFVRVFRG